MVLKKREDGSNTIVNLVYPVNNTLSIEIRKVQNNFDIKENVLQLYKKEVVIKNQIKNNLYSAAVDVGIEPNIIIEFARIFGFEVDFQRDIRKGDWFEILYEKFEDDNNIVQDTGKIIYASMFVNGNEINLYSFNDEKEIGFYDIKRKKYCKIFNENSDQWREAFFCFRDAETSDPWFQQNAQRNRFCCSNWYTNNGLWIWNCNKSKMVWRWR